MARSGAVQFRRKPAGSARLATGVGPAPARRVSAVGRPIGAADLRRRVYLLGAIVIGFGLVLIARLMMIQAIQHDHYSDLAAEEHWRRTVIPARRGDLLDTNGQALATSVSFQSLYASTAIISHPDKLAARLAPILGEPAEAIQAHLTAQQVAPVLIKAWLPDEIASEVRALKADGLFFQIEPERAYPQGNLAAQALGVVGLDNNGLSGLEFQLDSDLAGTPGMLVAERDTGGDTIPYGPHQLTPPVEGASVTLTFDRYIQWVAECALTAAVADHHARGGTVLVLEPTTGGVLALAGRPTFDRGAANLYSPESVALYGIPAVSDAYEPGSIFKVFTLAAALETGAVTPGSTYYNGGSFAYAGSIVRDAAVEPPGPQTMLQALARPTTLGMAWTATRVGAPAFYGTLQRFGLGKASGIKLPGEVSGQLRLPTEPDWFALDITANAIGQGLQVTPIQLVSAFATIANAGSAHQPYLIKRIAGPKGERVMAPVSTGRAIGPEAAAAVTSLLVATVDDAANPEAAAQIAGYAIAGKAGVTTRSVPGRYNQLSTLGTFIGYAPAAAPRFVILVRLEGVDDRPAEAAATTFASISRQLLSYYQIPPTRPQ